MLGMETKKPDDLTHCLVQRHILPGSFESEAACGLRSDRDDKVKMVYVWDGVDCPKCLKKRRVRRR